jgi:hypothetical protein
VGDRNYLVLAKPNVIMNDIRLRGLAVAGKKSAGLKSPDNHAQTVQNLRRSLRNAAAGARLIGAEGLDSKPSGLGWDGWYRSSAFGSRSRSSMTARG